MKTTCVQDIKPGMFAFKKKERKKEREKEERKGTLALKPQDFLESRLRI